MSAVDKSETVVIVGAGLMGRGIAHGFAAVGYQVSLVDIQPKGLTDALDAIRAILADGVRLGKVSAEQAELAMARVTTGTDLKAVLRARKADLLIETATENLAAKIAIAREADELLPPHAVIATNTSALSVTEIACATGRAERVLGMHFFNPVHKMKLLEIVRGLATSDDTIARARAWGESIGKTSIVVNEAPGLTTSRMSAMMGNEAMTMLMEGIASAEDIDTALRLGFNHPMGPLELGDLTGWDTRLAVLQYLHSTLGEKFRPCPLILKLVKAGRFGRKAGRGIYEYAEGKRVPGSGLSFR
ncbi:MAG: 3-hydroxyacyl-CoA dehydrogenase [Steroidobacteraceae bacterium]